LIKGHTEGVAMGCESSAPVGEENSGAK
jgi:hypothetical protein